jgi:uncharacterized membrane protein YphA (DoxX/SURF4 family)
MASWELALTLRHTIAVSLRIGVGILLVVAGAAKLVSLREFQRVIRAYKILPATFALPASWTLPVLELTAGIALASGVLWPLPQFAASGMFLVFAAAVGLNLVRGNRNVQCGCFGSAGKLLSWQIVMRNVGLVGVVLTTTERLTLIPVLLLSAWAFALCVPRSRRAPEPEHPA